VKNMGLRIYLERANKEGGFSPDTPIYAIAQSGARIAKELPLTNRAPRLGNRSDWCIGGTEPSRVWLGDRRSTPQYRADSLYLWTSSHHQSFWYCTKCCRSTSASPNLEIIEQGLFLVMGGLAWAFDTRKKRGRWGYEVPVPIDKYTNLLIAKPKKMVFEMKPVGEDRVQMIEKEWEDLNGGETADVAPNEKTVGADT
jgi:hypothetical protein